MEKKSNAGQESQPQVEPWADLLSKMDKRAVVYYWQQFLKTCALPGWTDEERKNALISDLLKHARYGARTKPKNLTLDDKTNIAEDYEDLLDFLLEKKQPSETRNPTYFQLINQKKPELSEIMEEKRNKLFEELAQVESYLSFLNEISNNMDINPKHQQSLDQLNKRYQNLNNTAKYFRIIRTAVVILNKDLLEKTLEETKNLQKEVKNFAQIINVSLN
ncbi:MAG: hypothetical protein COU31_01640 [Candidatus Magasanikbacteria bacterium CG10_big_fil_rev_8_21_14_0_10_40_10]|uniref:Uncharacterized protein n=1 Tax=Candidatus Magasanikbacteria bacterium CG10_big_fil_rev_8_21_14_0_10_40_10 TaxID=1974648 RepID=A0A2M6W4C6_9BACT|nr:MAG: hypothetical protein COU31_01640 [Candidatus Magasanikbacteria bacterium CG10_big_fil_rev_8_21_14_0_10_40_10]